MYRHAALLSPSFGTTTIAPTPPPPPLLLATPRPVYVSDSGPSERWQPSQQSSVRRRTVRCVVSAWCVSWILLPRGRLAVKRASNQSTYQTIALPGIDIDKYRACPIIITSHCVKCFCCIETCFQDNRSIRFLFLKKERKEKYKWEKGCTIFRVIRWSKMCIVLKFILSILLNSGSFPFISRSTLIRNLS